MKALVLSITLVAAAGCSMIPPRTPEEAEMRRVQAEQDAVTDRFETCMDSTLASFGPFTFGSQEARLKAAEICGNMTKAQQPAPAK